MTRPRARSSTHTRLDGGARTGNGGASAIVQGRPMGGAAAANAVAWRVTGEAAIHV